MNQIKETMEEKISSMEGQVADLRDMMKKMLELQAQTAASEAKGPEAKNTNSEIRREEEVEIVEGRRRRPYLEPFQREERGGRHGERQDGYEGRRATIYRKVSAIKSSRESTAQGRGKANRHSREKQPATEFTPKQVSGKTTSQPTKATAAEQHSRGVTSVPRGSDNKRPARKTMPSLGNRRAYQETEEVERKPKRPIAIPKDK
ncbi:hypothetical protein M5K25_007224 [Dendrobium thyrsiflorum]|uniref:Uncharacterized protein n=1 Tax=Dendrobium thyrsiflorum TaxID=117978 RepID=A0ABD0VD92_DENTH